MRKIPITRTGTGIIVQGNRVHNPDRCNAILLNWSITATSGTGRGITASARRAVQMISDCDAVLVPLNRNELAACVDELDKHIAAHADDLTPALRNALRRLVVNSRVTAHHLLQAAPPTPKKAD